MVHREDNSGLVVVTQPAHAWISGQLARAWGNERFGRFEPFEEMCLAADQHDAGWHAWELAPTLDPASGLPHRFNGMPLEEHLPMWPAGAQMIGGINRYSGLMVCLHGLRLRGLSPEPEDRREREIVRNFIECQQAARDAAIEALRRDPHYAPFSTEAVLARNHDLMAAWDWLSLGLCMHASGEWTAASVPDARGRCTLRLSAADGGGFRWTVSPWPFRERNVEAACEGRRIEGTFKDAEAMRAALAASPRVRLVFRLEPGPGI